MKNKFILFIFFLFFLSFVSSIDCFPKYECGEWSACVNGLSTRTCVDTKCGAADIPERQFCGEEKCQPDISCGEWSTCNFFEKTNNIIEEQLVFEGSKSRICTDKANCIDSFAEEEGCSLAVPIKVQKTQWCGEQLVEILNEKGNVVGRVKQEKITKNLKRVDISFVDESLPTYCPYCYDGEKNYDEQEKDCGGPSCPACVPRIDFFDWATLLSFFSWGTGFLLIILGFILISRNEGFNQGLRNLIYFFKPLSEEEARAREEKIKEFFVPKKISPEGFKNY